MPCHSYPTGAVELFLQLVLGAACSLRGASAALKLFARWLPGLPRMPTANTGQSWMLRIGLYELNRPKEAADDWVWIMDHTVQIGVVKCLLIVGCRLSAWRPEGDAAEGRSLEHGDLSMFALEPVERSDGATVHRQLEAVSQRTGIVPRVLLSDEGTDLKGGIKAFCGQHDQTVGALDVAHQAAKLLKRELEADPRWGEFFTATGGAKQRLAQTSLAHLLPPTPRTKARYMNLGELVAWGQKTLYYLEHPAPVDGVSPDPIVLRTKLGWLVDYREALGEWSQALETISIALDYIRKEGYHAGAAKQLRPQLALPGRAAISRRLAARLLVFVRGQSAAARPQERLIGSSECLESLIGKGKRLEGQQSRSGFTRMILGMPAAVAKLTGEYVARALAQVKTSDITAWSKKQFGISLQAQRRQALGAAGKELG